MEKIVDVKIELRKWDQSIVHATFENGEEKDIIHFYSDEIVQTNARDYLITIEDAI